jgi:hypothetical protein
VAASELKKVVKKSSEAFAFQIFLWHTTCECQPRGDTAGER